NPWFGWEGPVVSARASEASPAAASGKPARGRADGWRPWAATPRLGRAVATGSCNVTAGGTGATPTPSASPTAMSEADAKAALQKAAVELSKTSYKIQLVAGPVSGNGAMDA